MNLRLLTGLVAIVLVAASPIVTPAEPDGHRQAVERLFELTHMQRLQAHIGELHQEFGAGATK